MSLRFSMTNAQSQALVQLLADQQNPHSARYHQWLTPETFRAQFGVADADLAKAQAWLKAQGFTVKSIGRGGQYVRFSGTVATAQAAFQTKIQRVSVEGKEHIANTAALTLPAALSNITSAVTGVDDLALRPRTVRRIVSPTSSSSLSPQFTSSSATHYLAPGDLYTIYDAQNLISSGTDGTGVTIAVVGQTDIYPADIAAFRSAAGLAANAPTVSLYGVDPGYPSTDDLYESELDLEWAGAMAPKASVLFVTSTDVLNGSITEAIDNNVAPIISNSYGTCEADLGVSELAYYNQLLEQGAAQGITIVSPAGDSGAADCDYKATSATQGLAVDFPASSPYVTGVGGTTFSEGTGTYWSSTNGSTGGSATQYIPEVVWNDSTSGVNLTAGGGGSSSYFAKPSWQTGTIFGVAITDDGTRDVPDVSFSASANHDPYLLCTPNTCTNGFYDSTGSVAVIGGTSVGVPVFSGLMAMVVQKNGRVGVANNTLYTLAASSYASSVFHDVTSGSNAVTCTTGSTDCASGGTIGYTAATGYDRASGLGSVDAYNLVNDWPLVTATATTPAGAASSRTDIAGNVSSVTTGSAVTFTATVTSVFTSTTATPTGTVEFLLDGTVMGSATLSSSGVATYSLSTTGLAAGTHKMQASYAGDGTYAGSVGAFTFTVSTAVTQGFTLTPTTTTVNVASGDSSQGIVLTVTPTGGFTGNVAFTLSSTSTFAGQLTLSATSLNFTSTTAQSTTLTVLAFTGGLDSQHSATAATGLVAGAFALLLLIAAPRRRKLATLAIVAIGAAVTVGSSGCSNSATTPTSIASARTPTPVGTYTINVAATGTVNGTAVTKSSTVKVIVQ
ncbi:MAG: protease pro-enzyme activation domain-containing protein [Acidobacteriaceae bacterium]|nr:protease pro-enzyme activation domain-containing protein [Acidobacteriaceae bacterium]